MFKNHIFGRGNKTPDNSNSFKSYHIINNNDAIIFQSSDTFSQKLNFEDIQPITILNPKRSFIHNNSKINIECSQLVADIIDLLVVAQKDKDQLREKILKQIVELEYNTYQPFLIQPLSKMNQQLNCLLDNLLSASEYTVLIAIISYRDKLQLPRYYRTRNMAGTFNLSNKILNTKTQFECTHQQLLQKALISILANKIQISNQCQFTKKIKEEISKPADYPNKTSLPDHNPLLHVCKGSKTRKLPLRTAKQAKIFDKSDADDFSEKFTGSLVHNKLIYKNIKYTIHCSTLVSQILELLKKPKQNKTEMRQSIVTRICQLTKHATRSFILQPDNHFHKRLNQLLDNLLKMEEYELLIVILVYRVELQLPRYSRTANIISTFHISKTTLNQKIGKKSQLTHRKQLNESLNSILSSGLQIDLANKIKVELNKPADYPNKTKLPDHNPLLSICSNECIKRVRSKSLFWLADIVDDNTQASNRQQNKNSQQNTENKYCEQLVIATKKYENYFESSPLAKNYEQEIRDYNQFKPTHIKSVKYSPLAAYLSANIEKKEFLENFENFSHLTHKIIIGDKTVKEFIRNKSSTVIKGIENNISTSSNSSSSSSTSSNSNITC